MKKEFKAPIVETKVLSTANSIMTDGAVLLSANTGNGNNLLGWKDDAAVHADYKQWQGNN